MVLGKSGASFLRNLVTGMVKVQLEKVTVQLEQDKVITLTNFQMQKYYQNKHNFNGVNSWNNSTEIK